jgi:hypothetical protein
VSGEPVVYGQPAVNSYPETSDEVDMTGHTALDRPGQELELSHRQVRDFTTPRAALTSRDRPFKQSQLSRIDEALTLASRETGLLFSVYVGPLGGEPRATAELLFDKLAARHQAPVLVAVSPGERRMEIVTGGESARRIPNRIAGLAALAMRASFSSGDLTGGIVSGLRQLADAAGTSVVSYS